MKDLTPSQTIGPFFLEGLRWAIDATPRDFGVSMVRVTGSVFDAEGQPVPDALLEIWQPALCDFSYPGARLPGFQRVDTREGGRFAFWVPEPGASAVEAHVTVFARGLLNGLFTRVYLPAAGESVAPMPEGVPTERRPTLLARKCDRHPRTWLWDVRLQGPDETVFFAFA